MSKKRNLTGMTFGNLLVLEEYRGERKFPSTYWECECQCVYKTKLILRCSDLTSGSTTRCSKCTNNKLVFGEENDYMYFISNQGTKVLFDKEDLEIVKLRNWSTCGRYAIGKMNDKTMILHRLIMGALKGQYVDHINGNCFDNRKSNLRLCTNQENQFNRHASFGKSKYKGVNIVKHNKKHPYRAIVKFNGKSYHAGNFATEEEAAIAYDKKAKELFGEFARPNFQC